MDKVSFVGGMRWPAGKMTLGGNATWPFVRLLIDGMGITLKPNGVFKLLSFLIPSYTFEWQDVMRAEALRRGGVRLQVRTLHSPVIFWSFRLMLVLDALEKHGIPVDRSPKPVYGNVL